MIQSTMQRVALSINHLLERAGKLFPASEIVSRRPDKSLLRHRFADFYRRARQLAAALQAAGLKKGDRDGYLRVSDRTKDLVKSGGEWISSVDMENLLMGHPAVQEAAVIAVPDVKWGERPLACVVLKAGQSATPDALRAHLAGSFAKWQLPERIEYLDAIPRTSTGKFWKVKLRERFR